MPKLKTHRGAAKRFKKTGKGKLMRRHSYARHILTSKARSRKRRLAKGVEISPADQGRLSAMLPN
jgi:large subunit ribosomal protein L35